LPRALGAWPWLALCVAGLGAVPAVGAFALAILVLRRVRRIRPTLDERTGSAFVGTLVFCVVARLDPFGYMTWLFD